MRGGNGKPDTASNLLVFGAAVTANALQQALAGVHQAAPERHDEEAEIEVAEGSEGNAVEGSSEDIDEIKEEEPE